MTPEAIVVGAGICGASVAHFLAQRGMSLVVIEQSGIGRATTARAEGLVLVCDKPDGPERDLALTGRELWTVLGERFPAARVRRKDALLLGPSDGDPPVAGEPALAAGVAARLGVGELQVDAVAMAHALLTSIPVRHGRVIAVEPGEVALNDGERLRARCVVIATGPWARELTGLPVEPRKGSHRRSRRAGGPGLPHARRSVLRRLDRRSGPTTLGRALDDNRP